MQQLNAAVSMCRAAPRPQMPCDGVCAIPADQLSRHPHQPGATISSSWYPAKVSSLLSDLSRLSPFTDSLVLPPLQFLSPLSSLMAWSGLQVCVSWSQSLLPATLSENSPKLKRLFLFSPQYSTRKKQLFQLRPFTLKMRPICSARGHWPPFSFPRSWAP